MNAVKTTQTAVLWECCHDEDGEPFCPTGHVLNNKQEALQALKELRATTCPGAYLVRVLMTRCTGADETLDH
jgi:hypothetical protein